MVATDRPQPTGRRERWTVQENERRQAEYAGRLAAWQQVDAELADLIRFAWGSLGSSPAPQPADFVTHRNERILGHIPDVRLVGVARAPGTTAPGYGGYSPLSVPEAWPRSEEDAWATSGPDVSAESETTVLPVAGVSAESETTVLPVAGVSTPPPDDPDHPDQSVHSDYSDYSDSDEPYGSPYEAEEEYQPLESGRVTITNQRVVFHGSRDREWPLSRVVRVEHSRTRPLTLVHIANRRRISGLEYAGPHAASLRFLLTLAMAHHTGDIDGFVAHLEAERERYDVLRPPPPQTARPDEAPGRLALVGGVLQIGYARWREQSRALRLVELFAAGFLAVLATSLLAGGSGSTPHPTAGAELEAPAMASQPAASGGTATTQALDSSTPGPTSTVETTTASPTATTPTPTPTTTRPTRSATATAADLCGAPTNPYGYNFCGHGSLIYDPASDICSYFTCTTSVSSPSGYLVECGDHTFSAAGGRGGACARHHGVARPVYSGS